MCGGALEGGNSKKQKEKASTEQKDDVTHTRNQQSKTQKEKGAR